MKITCFCANQRIEPLPVTMSAVRMGERVLQIGVDDAAVARARSPRKVGLERKCGDRRRRTSATRRAHTGAAASAGVLVDVDRSTPLASLPFESDAFDLVDRARRARSRVVRSTRTTRLAAMREWHRVLRHGGRVMTIEAGPATGIASVFKSAADQRGATTASGGSRRLARGRRVQAGAVACRTRGSTEGFK